MKYSRPAKDAGCPQDGAPGRPDGDILVLGAGVVGVATAYALARRGYSVILVDREEGPGRGTSFANGAQLSYAYTDALAQPALLRKLPAMVLGLDPAFRFRMGVDPGFLRWSLAFLRNCTDARFSANTLAALRIGLESRLALHALQERHSLDFGHAMPGKMHLYRDPAAFARAAEVVSLKGDAGIEQHLLSPAEAMGIEPALANAGPLAGVLWTPADEVGDPHLFCRAMLELLRGSYGVRAEFGFSASHLREDGDAVHVSDPSGQVISARAAVICLGAGAPHFLARFGIRAPVRPMKGYSFTAPVGPRAPSVSLTDASRKIVFCRLGDQMRVAGLAELGNWSTGVDANRLNALVDSARAAMPDAADYDAAGTGWAGLRPMTPNSLPIIARARANLYLNIGHGMLGWTFAMGSAERTAALIETGLRPSLS
ncbi:D-amino-acid dehydrogenase [Sphingomonas laterariae]|uniref:D-amino-acid dehydrogenase n=2 Tax=Edaphosphingomonas laterariae TaxID=861865 RepID=A0A239DPI8_9SPHN|nr:D-amino-acid dehydrogenase [Sphingomonas laterariae]